MIGRFPIEDVTPRVAGGRYPAKAVVGELVPVSAVSYREGHSKLGCNVTWRGPDGAQRPFTRMRAGEPGLDQWHAEIRPDAVGRWAFAVEAWGDPYLTWHDAVTKKISAGQSLADVEAAVTALRDTDLPLFERVSPALDLADLLWRYPVREMVTSSASYPLWVDRERALFSAWYEFFPRSEGAVVSLDGKVVKHGTFA